MWGRSRAAFARGIFDVTADVAAGKAAGIAVHILPPPHPGNPNEHTIARGVGPNGGILTEDGPTFLCTQGWNWIPGIRDRDMGIWQDVKLYATGGVVIGDSMVSSDLPLPRVDSALLTVETDVRNVSGQRVSGILRGEFEAGEFQTAVSLEPGESRHVKMTAADHAALHVERPRLWWPNGYGEPNLYTLRLTFEVDGEMSDRARVSLRHP